MSTIILGYNRSGTTIVSKIIEEIYKTKNINFIPDQNELKKFNKIFNNFKKISLSNKLFFCSYSAVKFNSLDFFSSGLKKFVYIQNITKANYNINEVLRLYAKPNKKIFSFFKKKKSKVIQVNRNPLDLIVSNAFEIENFLEYTYPDFFNNNNFSITRDCHGYHFLNDRNWVKSQSKLIAEYYLSFQNMTKNIDSVKYEEILKEPIRTTINISRYLNLPISVREAKIIWKKVGLKNLKNYKTHFFNPSINKYKNYLTSEIVNNIMKNSSLKKIMNLYNYKNEIDSISISQKKISIKKIKKIIETRKLLQKIQFNVNTTYDENFIKKATLMNGKKEINIYSNSIKVLRHFEKNTLSILKDE